MLLEFERGAEREGAEVEEVKKEERRRVGVVGGERKEAAVVRGSSRDGEVGGDGRKGKGKEERNGTLRTSFRSFCTVD